VSDHSSYLFGSIVAAPLWNTGLSALKCDLHYLLLIRLPSFSYPYIAMPDATENEISETLVSPGSSQLEIDASTSAGGDQMYVPDRYRSLNAICSGLAPPTYPLRVFKTIASATQGPRNETSLATYLVPKPQKRHANNFTGVTGTERCTFCVKAKKKVHSNWK